MTTEWIRDKSQRPIGRLDTDNNGVTHIWDSHGKVLGRMNKDGSVVDSHGTLKGRGAFTLNSLLKV